MTPKELEKVLRDLLKRPLADTELRAQLERLAAAEISFAGFTWLFGPELYRRNRVLFRPLVLSRFSTYLVLPKWKVQTIPWKGEAARGLEAWLQETDQADDPELFRRLYDWKLSTQLSHRFDDARDEAIREELRRRFQKAGTPAARHMVLRKLDLWFVLDEPTATELYEADARAAAPFILRHLPHNWYSLAPKRTLWRSLFELAERRRDESFRWKLYRRQIALKDWIKDVLSLAGRVRDPSALVSELEKRHPEGWGVNLADGFCQLVEQRGRDAFPYVMRHLRQVWGSWLGRGHYGKLADLARARGWWDLWSALIRVCSGAKEFNKEVHALVANTQSTAIEVAERLLMLSGASREWNWAGLGLATVHTLDEEVALALYERFPDLVRGPFRLHVQPNLWGKPSPLLLDRFLAAGDEEMIDQMASRVITRAGSWGQAQAWLVEAEKLAGYYRALKTDERVFSRRAASVLGRIPAYAIRGYDRLVQENRLARLLFERSAATYLADPASIADLVEGSEIHVMALAYRALGLHDPRARAQAAQHLPLLLGTLLRPMHRATRLLAFGALVNAADSLDTAREILQRARDALHLPDERYPKEQLLGLLAGLLHRWPELRGPAEQPVIYSQPA